MTKARRCGKRSRAADNRFCLDPVAAARAGPDDLKRGLDADLVPVCRRLNGVSRSRPGRLVHAVLVGPCRFSHVLHVADARKELSSATVQALRQAHPSIGKDFPYNFSAASGFNSM